MLKKYINRRLYDTETHRYVSVRRVRERLIAGEAVQCMRTNRDIAPSILCYIVQLDIEAGKGPTTEEFAAFIRSYSGRKWPKRVEGV